jgi:hypothetical protein
LKIYLEQFSVALEKGDLTSWSCVKPCQFHAQRYYAWLKRPVSNRKQAKAELPEKSAIIKKAGLFRICLHLSILLFYFPPYPYQTICQTKSKKHHGGEPGD